MTFEEYLVKKRINREVFAAEDPSRYKAWESMYAQMHPNSFYVAVKMVLNNVRLRYHLREEDVPKPAPTAMPRPAARRAAAPAASTEAVPSAVIPETPTAIPAATDVPQETAEEKQVTPAAAAKPRPVVRRPAALQKPTTEEEATTEKSAEGTTPATPRARPVIKRPVMPKQDAAASADTIAADKPVAQEPAVPRPRPVIKRPAALAKPTDAPQQGEEAKNEQAIPEASKPARPRPVIKRPAALQKPAQESETPIDNADKPVVKDMAEANTGIATDAAITPADAAADAVSPKPPRPRPVIKRPVALQKPTDDVASSADTGIAPVNADAVADAGIAPTADESTVSGIASESSASAETPKPPRPRPIIKRPTALVQPKSEQAGDAPAIPEQASPETPTGQPKDAAQEEAMAPDAGIPDMPPADEGAMPEAQKPKPPRPRPIMRRPPPKAEE